MQHVDAMIKPMQAIAKVVGYMVGNMRASHMPPTRMWRWWSLKDCFLPVPTWNWEDPTLQWCSAGHL